MYLLILYFSVVTSIILGFGGKLLGKFGSSFLSVCNLFILMLISLFIFYEVIICNTVTMLTFNSWVNFELFEVRWGLLFDKLSVLMVCLVIFISLIVHIYSIGYMGSDPFLTKFLFLLTLFTTFMLILVTSNNFLQFFFGWEGVGLVSYLLINFWNTRIVANKAAFKAIIINRIGDFTLLLAIVLIGYKYKSLDYDIIFTTFFFDYLNSSYEILFFGFTYIDFIVYCLIISAVAKSSQIVLHTWLQDAMEGPTPVSALIHSATMVTAGIFLLMRTAPLLIASLNGLLFISIIGVVTAFFGALLGINQYDIKKIIACSTCSQLGYLMFCCGLLNIDLVLFHIFNHAFFKALLFLTAGVLIHSISGEQDIRKMGGLLKLSKFTYIIFFFSSLSLCGFPYLTGYYSKDLILEITGSMYNIPISFFEILMYLASCGGVIYSYRLIYYIYFGKPRMSRVLIESFHHINIYMSISLIILFLASIFFGYLFKDSILGISYSFYNDFIENIVFIVNIESDESHYYNTIIPLVLSILTVLVTIIAINTNIFMRLKIVSNISRRFLDFSNMKWMFDYIYNYIANIFLINIGYSLFYYCIDRGALEVLGGLSLIRYLYIFSKYIKDIQTGLIYHYAFVILLGIILLLTYLSIIYILALDTEILLFIILSIYLLIYKYNILK
jgi:proton-translocating NADH-quinone oxidoreductase chain L